MASNPDTLIIVPCFNEEERLRPRQFHRFTGICSEVGFVFVDDASRDGTRSVLEGMTAQSPERMWCVVKEENGGKAEAVRSGVQFALGLHDWRHVGYWDADLATPLEEIPRFLEILCGTRGVEFVMGCRLMRLGAEIRRHAWRHYLGRLFATAASLALDLGVYDTQCGAKLMSRRLAELCFSEPFLSPWLFDVEIIARIKRARGAGEVETLIHELPLTCWRDVDGSKVKLSYYAKAPVELWRIRRFYGKG